MCRTILCRRASCQFIVKKRLYTSMVLWVHLSRLKRSKPANGCACIILTCHLWCLIYRLNLAQKRTTQSGRTGVAVKCRVIANWRLRERERSMTDTICVWNEPRYSGVLADDKGETTASRIRRRPDIKTARRSPRTHRIHRRKYRRYRRVDRCRTCRLPP